MIPCSCSMFLQIDPTTTSDVITGRKNAARNSPRNRIAWFNSRAEPRPRTGPMPIPRSTKTTVLRKADRKRWSPRISA